MYDEWITRKTREPMKWFGTAMFLFSSIIVSAFPSMAAEWWPFAGFMFGHCLWTVAGIHMKDGAVVTLNAMYIPIDIYAIFIRLS